MAESEGVFDEAALMACCKFKFEPKFSEGVAVAVHGIRNKVTFARAD